MRLEILFLQGIVFVVVRESWLSHVSVNVIYFPQTTNGENAFVFAMLPCCMNKFQTAFWTCRKTGTEGQHHQLGV